MDIQRNRILFLGTLFALLYGCVSAGEMKTEGKVVSDAHQSRKQKISFIQSIAPLYGTYITQDSTQQITFTLQPDVIPDSVILSMGEHHRAIDTAGYRYSTTLNHPTGRIVYKITVYRGGEQESRSGEFTILAAAAPKLYGHTVRKSYPHREDAYTQGLLWHNGSLYESTGLEKRSSLRKVELSSGRPIITKLLDNQHFGEGLALLNGKLYQLTWQNNKAFVYDLEHFELIETFEYSGEGWGLTTDGKHLYMSDGSEKIYVLDPETFKRIRTIEVYTDQSKVPYINEMEWIKGEIWANIYMTDTIIRIDPQTGAVTGVVDMSNLLDPSNRTPDTDVLNGIAFDSKTGRIFVTGKNWSHLFEITVNPK